MEGVLCYCTDVCGLFQEMDLIISLMNGVFLLTVLRKV
jgi:hypothetical protein